MTPRSLLRRSVLATLPVFALACTDAPTSPSLRPPADPSSRRSTPTSTRTPRTSNLIKYSDTGVQPTSISVNGITLSSRAYALSDGRTYVDIVTGRFEAPSTTTRIYGMSLDVYTATGYRIKSRDLATMIQAASFDWKGGMPSVRLTVKGLAKDSRIEFTLLAGGPSRKSRTTLRMTTLVKWAPDLQVSRVDVPSQVHATELVPVVATVREGRGDYGGRADCVLSADGVVVDRAPGIWVDAGGTVSCAFATRFTSLGARTLRVSLASVTPAEFDPVDNSREASVDVVPLPVQMTYRAEALQHTGRVTEEFASSFVVVDDATLVTTYAKTYTLNREWNDQNQSAWLFASAPVPVTFPLGKLVLAMTADGRPLDGRAYTDVAGGTPFGTVTEGGVCGQNGDSGFGFIVCTYHSPGATWTTVYYNQDYSGTVTYESTELTIETTPAGTVIGTPGYVFNGDRWGKFTSWDRTLGFTIDLTDGLFRLQASPIITLADNAYGTPSRPCTVSTVKFDGATGTVTECRDIREQYFDKGGLASRE
jgi:hypothetical protein